MCSHFYTLFPAFVWHSVTEMCYLADAWHPKLPLRLIFHSTSDFGWIKWDFRDPILLNFRVLFLNTGSQNGIAWISLLHKPILNILLLYLTVLEASARQWSLVPQAKWCSMACEQANTVPKAPWWNHAAQHLRDTPLSGSICSACSPNTHLHYVWVFQ